MTIIAYLASREMRAERVVCNGPTCQRSTTVPMTYPWLTLTTFGGDGRLIAQLDYCGRECLVAHQVTYMGD